MLWLKEPVLCDYQDENDDDNIWPLTEKFIIGTAVAKLDILSSGAKTCIVLPTPGEDSASRAEVGVNRVVNNVSMGAVVLSEWKKGSCALWETRGALVLCEG